MIRPKAALANSGFLVSKLQAPWINRLSLGSKVRLNDSVFFISVRLTGIKNPIWKVCRATIIHAKSYPPGG